MLAEQRLEFFSPPISHPKITYIDQGAIDLVGFQQQKYSPPLSLPEPVDFLNKLEQKRGKSQSFSLWERPYSHEAKNSFLLPGTGLDVRGQTNSLIRDLQTASDKGISFEEATNQWLNQTVIDIKEGVNELLKDRLVFAWSMAQEKGSNRFIDKRYGKYVDEFVANEDEGRGYEERWGSVRRSLNAIGHKLTLADEGLFGWWSVEGRSNLPDGQGGEVIYQDTYLNLYNKNGVEVEVVTVKLSLAQRECERIIRRMVAQGSLKIPESSVLDELTILRMSEEERIMNLVEMAGEFKSGLTFEGVLDKVRVLSGKRNAWEGVVQKKNRRGKVENVRVEKSYSELMEELRCREQLQESDELTVHHSQYFYNEAIKLLSGKDYRDLTFDDLDKLEEVLGRCFLNLVVGFKGEDFSTYGDFDKYAFVQSDKIYKAALNYLQTRPGCAGGRSINEEGFLAFGSDRLYFIMKGYEPRTGTCRDCGERTVVANCKICRKCDENYSKFGYNSRRSGYLEAA